MANHTIFCSCTKEVLVCGLNCHGQLGLNDENDRKEPQYLMQNKDIIQIICSDTFTIILKCDGKIVVFGSNRHGQLGLTSRKNICIPTLIVLDKQVTQISCGNWHTLILTIVGQVFSLGGNSYGQRGLGHNDGKDGKDGKDGNNDQHIMQQVATTEKIIRIACGGFHSIMITNNYEIMVFGCNDYGQLGLGHYNNEPSPKLLMKNENITKIVCGWGHTIMLNDNGQVYVFGCNKDGILGLNTCQDQNTPQLLTTILDKKIVQIACAVDSTIFLSDNGELWHIAPFIYKPVLLITDNEIVQITCGSDHIAFLKDNGQMFVIGDNEFGQLGLGHRGRHEEPQLLRRNVTMMFNTVDLLKWMPEHHRYFSAMFREKIWVFLLVLKRFQRLTKIYVPKFLRFEIVKKCV